VLNAVNRCFATCIDVKKQNVYLDLASDFGTLNMLQMLEKGFGGNSTTQNLILED
jgi:hypothetical protein